jgi:hypothetical protein
MTEGNLCDGGCTDCVNAAINVRDQDKYQSDFSSKVGTKVNCSCPGIPVGCVAGMCGIATAFPMRSDASAVEAATDAGADAGASDASVLCPDFQSQPTCPAAPGAVDCARPSIGCGPSAR